MKFMKMVSLRVNAVVLPMGEKRGIAGMLDLLKELGCSANDAKLHLKNKLHLSEDTANEYIQKCWNTK